MSTIQAKDLTQEAPRSAYDTSLGGYAILARAVDKGRATIAGTNGEFNFNCPADNMFLEFKGLKGEELKDVLASGASDEEVLEWVNSNGIPRTPEEIKEWSESHKSDFTYANHPDEGKRAWFIGECQRLGLDPTRTTLFDYLDVDDKTIGK